MNKLITALLASLAISVSATAADKVAVTEEAVQPARIVIYRAEESSKTRKIRFNASVDGEKVGRLNYSAPVVTEVAAGETWITTSIAGSDTLKVDLLPGHTYYVHTKLKRLGQKVTPSMVIVDEQVALSQMPALEGAI